MRLSKTDGAAARIVHGGLDIAALRAEMARRGDASSDARRRRARATTALLPLGVACGGRPRREAPRRRPPAP